MAKEPSRLKVVTTEEQQRTVWTVMATLVVVILVVVSVMAYQSLHATVPLDDAATTADGAITYEPYKAVKVSFTLPTLTTGQYALWVLTESGESLLVSTWQVDEQGVVIDTENNSLPAIFVTAVDLHVAEAFLVTIETLDRTPTTPSTTHVLTTRAKNSGRFLLSLPYDFTEASGTFILATPTNGANTGETSGYWFVNEDSGEAVASLVLPAAPSGWSYESWVVSAVGQVSGGRFLQPKGQDSFSNYSGPRSFPDFPGEDLLTNAPKESGLTFPLDLADGQFTVAVNLEPAGTDTQGDQTGDTQYQLTLLQRQIPLGTDSFTNLTLANVFVTPTGSVTILTR